MAGHGPTRPTLISLGLTHETKTFSSAAISLPLLQSAKTLQESLSGKTPKFIRDATLGDSGRVQQLAVPVGDKIMILSCPRLITEEAPDGTLLTTVIGSLSDSLANICPVSILMADVRGFFTTLAPRAVAEEFKLSMLDNLVPDDIDSASDPVVPRSMARLNFPYTVEAHTSQDCGYASNLRDSVG